MATAIKVENVSKAYRLGQIGTGTIANDLQRWYARVRGKEDPFLMVGEINDRTVKGNSNVVWSLKDINFEIEQGDAVGIIGRNGAGKSTLLKILSRVTAPTTGRITGSGRVASLLEVGTGFHPELSGRDNVYLNGTILGMRKKEVKRKFDEIVDFSGVERYIDTPVKRYSSGMYVRLAFAVAAYLESEILIVDEVLAVGDIEFQKKCLGKMDEVSKREGRTVLFVSHNMYAIKSFCKNCFFLKNGFIKSKGELSQVLQDYQLDINSDKRSKNINTQKKSFFFDWYIVNGVTKNSVISGSNFKIIFSFNSIRIHRGVEIGLVIRDNTDLIIFSVNSRDYEGNFFDIEVGEYKFSFDLQLPIKSGDYSIDIVLVSESKLIDQWQSPIFLKVLNTYESVLNERWTGIVSIKSSFEHRLTT